jgi:hypothetical protein
MIYQSKDTNHTNPKCGWYLDLLSFTNGKSSTFNQMICLWGLAIKNHWVNRNIMGTARAKPWWAFTLRCGTDGHNVQSQCAAQHLCLGSNGHRPLGMFYPLESLWSSGFYQTWENAGKSMKIQHFNHHKSWFPSNKAPFTLAVRWMKPECQDQLWGVPGSQLTGKCWKTYQEKAQW